MFNLFLPYKHSLLRDYVTFVNMDNFTARTPSDLVFVEEDEDSDQTLVVVKQEPMDWEEIDFLHSLRQWAMNECVPESYMP
mgnify:CR=1 FL=1